MFQTPNRLLLFQRRNTSDVFAPATLGKARKRHPKSKKVQTYFGRLLICFCKKKISIKHSNNFSRAMHSSSNATRNLFFSYFCSLLLLATCSTLIYRHYTLDDKAFSKIVRQKFMLEKRVLNFNLNLINNWPSERTERKLNTTIQIFVWGTRIQFHIANNHLELDFSNCPNLIKLRKHLL